LPLPERAGVPLVAFVRRPGRNRIDQEPLLRQVLDTVALCGEQVELVAVERLGRVVRNQDRRFAELTKQLITDARKELAEPLVERGELLDFEHHQRRVSREEASATLQDRLLLAFGIDLDEIGRPILRRVL